MKKSTHDEIKERIIATIKKYGFIRRLKLMIKANLSSKMLEQYILELRYENKIIEMIFKEKTSYYKVYCETNHYHSHLLTENNKNETKRKRTKQASSTI